MKPRKSAGSQGRGGSSAKKAESALARLRNVPPPSPRRGVNSQKQVDVRKERLKAKRKNGLRRVFAVVKVFFLTVLITGGLAGVGYAGYLAFQKNDLLVLRNVEVVGNHLLAKATILQKAGLELGSKLPSIPVRDVEASLRTLPGIGDVDVRRVFPSKVEITVHEKEPVAMGYSKGWYGLAPDGSRISGLDWAQSDLPVVDGFAAMDTVTRARLGRFLSDAKRVYPALYANFSQLATRGSEGLEIILRDGRLKVLFDVISPGPAGLNESGYVDNTNINKSLNSLEFLQALMRQQASSLEPGKTVDLRVEGYAYVR